MLESAHSRCPESLSLVRQLQTLGKLKHLLHSPRWSKINLLPWKQWKLPSSRLHWAHSGLTHTGWGIAMGKFLQMMLRHRLIVMPRDRKHPENKRKMTKSEKELWACLRERDRSIPVVARNWWEVRLGNETPSLKVYWCYIFLIWESNTLCTFFLNKWRFPKDEFVLISNLFLPAITVVKMSSMKNLH